MTIVGGCRPQALKLIGDKSLHVFSADVSHVSRHTLVGKEAVEEGRCLRVDLQCSRAQVLCPQVPSEALDIGGEVAVCGAIILDVDLAHSSSPSSASFGTRVAKSICSVSAVRQVLNRYLL